MPAAEEEVLSEVDAGVAVVLCMGVGAETSAIPVPVGGVAVVAGWLADGCGAFVDSVREVALPTG